jgi:glycosyltransferase involved in cell wall biosynthesis
LKITGGKMKQPRITVVTPSKNQATYLEETIDSVLSQDYPNLEYFIVDGGSSDGSLDIIKNYADKIDWWVSEIDQGHGHALNKGFQRSTGEIMAWINSDDKYLPWTFQIVSEIFTLFPQVKWITGLSAHWSDRGFLTHADGTTKNIYDYLLGDYRWIQQESVFWRRDLWEAAGGYVDQQYTFMVDGELWTRFFLLDNLYQVECILGGYRHHDKNRASTNPLACNQEMESAIEDLRQKCPKHILANLEGQLEWEKIRNSRIRRIFKGGDTAVTSIYAGITEQTAYDIISYDSGKWVMGKWCFR